MSVIPSHRRGGVGPLKTLIPYLWPPGQPALRVRVVVALACLAAAKFANVYVPILYKYAIDSLDGSGGVIALPLGVIFAYGAARVASLTFAELRDAVFAKVGQRAIRTIALSVFRHLHALSLRFHLERQTGGLSRSIERGTMAISTLLSFMLFSILPTILEMVLVFVILWTLLDLWFALVTIATVIAYITYTLTVTEWRLEFRRRMNEQDNRANTRAIDSLLNYETVKYFANEDHEAQRYDEALRAYEKAGVLSQASLSVLNIGQAVIISSGMTAVMYMAGSGIVAGTMTLGDFVLANTYLLQLYQPLGFFGFVYREIKQSLIDMEKLFDLLIVPHEVADAPDAPELSLNGAELSFEDVHFAYDPRREILKGISFNVPAGRTVAIVGPSGSGKSTIARLLFRFYDVGSGRILIDGQDIRSVTQRSLRAAIGIVPQDTVLFNDTIEYNLLYGRPSAAPVEARRAAELAHIAESVMRMPDGYKTVVGERGLKLSGGEKQRVAIARTILKDPKLLILDEATSALDSKTEQSIQANLRELSVGRTTVTIAHRLSTVIDADQIVVIDAGRIVERGTHTELLAADAEYALMWRRQQEHGNQDAASGDGKTTE